MSAQNLNEQTSISRTKEEYRIRFITLLFPKGKGPEAVRHLRELKPPEDITIRDLYFTLGRYDNVIIFDAPTAEIAMSFVMQIGFETGYTVETLLTVQAKEL